MQAHAISKHVRISPYKLRPYVDVIRGNSVDKAYKWLETCSNRRIQPILKTLLSAVANLKNLHADLDLASVQIKEVRVDQGPIIKYFKPGAMGRGNVQRKRLSHIKVVVAGSK